jgi:pyruvate/2-oxoglutarate dehydrogenase complex dihydrolipoamide acyltransferase (E2) component
VLGAPALRAQEGAPPAEGLTAPDVGAPAVPPAPDVSGQQATPPTPPPGPGAQPKPEEKPKAPEIKIPARPSVDPQLDEFRADLARRTGPGDKAEMLHNEWRWYENLDQEEYNALPAHKDTGSSCGSEWWREYCGN